MKFLFLLLTFIFSANAQVEVGNGGHVIRCSDSYYTQDLFDLYENHSPLAQAYPETFRNYLVMALGNLKTPLPGLYQDLKRVFKEDLRFEFTALNHAVLDTPHAQRVPDRCLVYPGAKFFKDQKKFYLNSLIWNKLDARNQAALILHEAIYYVLVLEKPRGDWYENHYDITDVVEYIIQEAFKAPF